jgi:hypothetical protein
MVREAQVDRATLVRGAAVAAALSGLLNLLFFALHPRQGEPPPPGALGPSYAWLHLLGLLSLILGLFGLTAFYLVQHRRVGWLGLAGYLLAFIGSCGFIGFLWGDGLYSPVFERFSPALLDAPALFFTGPLYIASAAAAFAFILGYVSFGIASYRAAVLPRDGIIAMTTGAVLVALPPPPLVGVPWALIVAGAAILAAGLGRIGFALWRAPLAD